MLVVLGVYQLGRYSYLVTRFPETSLEDRACLQFAPYLPDPLSRPFVAHYGGARDDTKAAYASKRRYYCLCNTVCKIRVYGVRTLVCKGQYSNRFRVHLRHCDLLIFPRQHHPVHFHWCSDVLERSLPKAL